MKLPTPVTGCLDTFQAQLNEWSGDRNALSLPQIRQAGRFTSIAGNRLQSVGMPAGGPLCGYYTEHNWSAPNLLKVVYR